MGRQRAEESLNSFNAAPPLSDARRPRPLLSVLGPLGAVSSQQEVKDHTFLKTGWWFVWLGVLPPSPKSSIAIIPEIAQSTWFVEEVLFEFSV